MAGKSADSQPRAMPPAQETALKAFKTRHFAKDAKAAGIADDELCDAIDELQKGQGDPLGANVWKKRLAKNRYRSILVSKPAHYWLFVYLFAKKDRENIDPDELATFKKLSKDYAAAPLASWKAMIKNGDLKEICDDEEDREAQ
jgi:hypothetical protein